MLARCDVMLCDGFYSNSNSFIFAASYISIQLIIIFLFPVLNDAVLSPHTSATPSPPSFLLPPLSLYQRQAILKLKTRSLIHPTPGHNRPERRKTIMSR